MILTKKLEWKNDIGVTMWAVNPDIAMSQTNSLSDDAKTAARAALSFLNARAADALKPVMVIVAVWANGVECDTILMPDLLRGREKPEKLATLINEVKRDVMTKVEYEYRLHQTAVEVAAEIKAFWRE